MKTGRTLEELMNHLFASAESLANPEITDEELKTGTGTIIVVDPHGKDDPRMRLTVFGRSQVHSGIRTRSEPTPPARGVHRGTRGKATDQRG